MVDLVARYGVDMGEPLSDVDDVRRVLSRDRRQAWIRLVLGPSEVGESPVWAADITVGPRPDAWFDARWDYHQCSFATAQTSVRRASAAITGQPGYLDLDNIRARFDVVSGGQQSWLRHASRHRYANVELSWPCSTITLRLAEAQQQPRDYLVGLNGPSFPTFAGAYGAFFWGGSEMMPSFQPILDHVVVRVVNRAARIRRVVAGPASVDVWVGGTKARGSRIEINSASIRTEAVLAGPGKVSMPLPDGPNQETWIWLKDDSGGWIDLRSFGGWVASRSQDVEFETATDPVSDITALASQGESATLEYKVQLPEDTKESKRRVLKTVVAFANADGGTILFGVQGDDEVGNIVGVSGSRAVALRRINDLIRSLVTPSPSFRCTGITVEGRFVIRLDVDQGHGIIYALTLDEGRPEFFVRRNGSTYYARPEELAAIARLVVAEPPAPIAY